MGRGGAGGQRQAASSLPVYILAFALEGSAVVGTQREGQAHGPSASPPLACRAVPAARAKGGGGWLAGGLVGPAGRVGQQRARRLMLLRGGDAPACLPP